MPRCEQTMLSSFRYCLFRKTSIFNTTPIQFRKQRVRASVDSKDLRIPARSFPIKPKVVAMTSSTLSDLSLRSLHCLFQASFASHPSPYPESLPPILIAGSLCQYADARELPAGRLFTRLLSMTIPRSLVPLVMDTVHFTHEHPLDVLVWMHSGWFAAGVVGSLSDFVPSSVRFHSMHHLRPQSRKLCPLSGPNSS